MSATATRNAVAIRDTETDNGYENKARRIARLVGIIVSAKYADPQKCPPWEGREERSRYSSRDCGRIHGDLYYATIRREHDERASITFDFWNSQSDSDKGGAPGYYNILASVSSDAQGPTTADEVYAEYGDMKPSQAEAVAAFARRLQRFFTEAEREALAEIN
jgi:hypothetical protein